MTRAMVLAAGLGSRLGALSEEKPKPLLPMCNVPLIRFPLALLAAAGVREAAVNLFHLGERIEAELGSEAEGVALTYFRERALLGTGGGLRNARSFLASGPFFVINGKVVIDLDLSAVLEAHRRSGALATLVVREAPDAGRWGAVTVDERGMVARVLGRGRPARDGERTIDTMFTGVHVVEPELLARLPDGESCIIRQGYIPALEQGARVAAVFARARGYFAEHSTPERYLEGNLALLREPSRLAHPPRPLAGVDRAARIAPTAVLHPPVCIAAGAVVEDGAIVGPATVLGAGARVARGAEVRESVVWPGAHVAGTTSRAIVTGTRRAPAPP